MKKFWTTVKNYQSLIALMLTGVGIITLSWKVAGEPFLCGIIARENAPIYRTLDYLIACNQAKMSTEEMQRADSLFMVNQKWKELRSK